MFELIKCYAEEAPATRFIGKKYHNEDRGSDGGFGDKWNEYMRNKWNEQLEKAAPGADKLFVDGLSHIGLMRWATDEKNEPFEYWIGIFAPPGTTVPEGFESVDFESATLGVVWIRAEMNDLFAHEGECAGLCEKNGMKIASVDNKGKAWYFFERYVDSRFGVTDSEGKQILDICHYVI